MSEHHEPPADDLLIGGRDARPKGRGRAYLAGGALAVLAVGGGAAAWAALSFFGTGAQPAEALPASTLGYVSVDLDPSGAQKIEALKLARKFPAFKSEVGLDSDDDLRQWIVEEFAKDSGCDLDFETDVEPWLGSRAAMAAVDGEDGPFPVFVLQTTDADRAEKGLAAFAECGGDEAGWRIDGDWIVLAETEAQADAAVAATDEGTLADDADFRKWTERVGDSGLLTAYAAPEVGGLLAEAAVADLGDVAQGPAALPGCEAASAAYEEELRAKLTAFDGAAATVKFNGGGVELQATADSGIQTAAGLGSLASADIDNRAVTGLPADTAFAFGVGLPEGWATALKENLAALCGEGVDPESFGDELAEGLGFDVFGELPQVLGRSVVVALGADIDVEALMNSSDPTGLPLAIRTTGDKAAVDRVVASLASSFGVPQDLVTVREGEDGVAVSLDATYAEQVAAGGELGKDEVFRDLVPNAADASFVSYLNLDRLQPAIEQLAGGDQEAVENLAPLRGVGLSSWNEDDELHVLLRVSVD